MKNYYTTLEQGERLVSAGYLPETADAFWLRHGDFFAEGHRLMKAPLSSWISFTEDREDCVPAWSMGALWDLCEDSPLSFSTLEDRADSVIEALVKRLIETSPYELI